MLLNLKTSLLIVLAFTFTNCGNSQKEDQSKTPKTSNKEVQSDQIIKIVSTDEAQELIASQPELTIIDLRTDAELQNGYLKNAVQINFQDKDFQSRIKTLDKSKPYLIYCHGGGRSGATRDLMEKEGFSKVYDMSSGFSGWSQQNLPLVKDNPEAEASSEEIENYNSQISDEGITMVNFYATWCGICKKNRPILKDYGTAHPDIQIVEFDSDQHKGIKNHLKIQAIPTLLIYKNGELIQQKTGPITQEEIDQLIQ